MHPAVGDDSPPPVKAPKEATPKGKPKSPGIDPELEPLRQAMAGGGSVIVSVNRQDEVLACVAEFERYNIKPVLWGAAGAASVADQIRGRVAGVLGSSEAAILSRKGIPVGFHSASEAGAAQLPANAMGQVRRGMGPEAILRSLTSDAAMILGIGDRVGLLKPGMDADVLLLDGSPLDTSSIIQRVWVNGEEIQ